MNTFFTPRFRLGWILIIIAVVNAFGWMLLRWSYENSYVRTQITVDYEDTRLLADAYQVSHQDLLRDLKEAGVTSVAVYQQTLNTLQNNGRIAITPRGEAERLYPNVKWDFPLAYRYLITTTPEDQNLLYYQLLPRLQAQGQANPNLRPRVVLLQPAQKKQPAVHGILLPNSSQLRADAQMGFDGFQVRVVREAGLQVTARLGNPLNLNLDRMRALLDEAKEVGARVVIFSEEEVMGYETMIADVAREMRNRGLVFGTIEFSKQRGLDTFARRSGGQLVRVHSVSGDEAAKSKMEVLLDRFVRAVKERNMRVAYFRMIKQFKGEYVHAEEDGEGSSPVVGGQLSEEQVEMIRKKSSLEQNLDLIKDIAHELEEPPLAGGLLRPGLTMKGATGFGDFPVDWLTPQGGDPRNGRILRYLGLFVSALGAVGAALLLLNLLYDLSRRAQMTWLVAGLAIISLLLLFDYASEISAASRHHSLLFKVLGLWPNGMGVKLISLEVGCLFTPIAMLWGGLPRLWDVQESRLEQVSLGKTFWAGVGLLVKTSLLTFAGSVLIIALLNHWKFFSKADEFFGEKATLLFPLLAIAILFGGEIFPHRVIAEGARVARVRARAHLQTVLDQPFTFRVAVTGLILLVAGMLFLARTGNESGMEISPLELKFRALLEHVFITRPRTKEIFLGHPAMIFAVWFALRRHSLLAWGAAVGATLGQADVLNTFCHIHTPIFYSLLRSIHSVWLGAVCGGIVLWIYAAIERRIAERKQRGSVPPGAPAPLEEALSGDGHQDGARQERVRVADQSEPGGVATG
ncbi:MAG: DUF5693 family protein [Armatimonadota bacterium]|nr:DUF5693 family protein [Armatimonadota bacterium]